MIVALTSGLKRRPRRTSLLGVENPRRWATLTLLASIDGKPPELTATVLVRAALALESGDFDRAQKLVREAGKLYVQAVMWADDAAGRLFQQTATAHPRAA